MNPSNGAVVSYQTDSAAEAAVCTADPAAAPELSVVVPFYNEEENARRNVPPPHRRAGGHRIAITNSYSSTTAAKTQRPLCSTPYRPRTRALSSYT